MITETFNLAVRGDAAAQLAMAEHVRAGVDSGAIDRRDGLMEAGFWARCAALSGTAETTWIKAARLYALIALQLAALAEADHEAARVDRFHVEAASILNVLADSGDEEAGEALAALAEKMTPEALNSARNAFKKDR